jgi:hypothetical protein
MYGKKNDLLKIEFYKKEKKKKKTNKKKSSFNSQLTSNPMCFLHLMNMLCGVSTFFQYVSLIELNAWEEE